MPPKQQSYMMEKDALLYHALIVVRMPPLLIPVGISPAEVFRNLDPLLNTDTTIKGSGLGLEIITQGVVCVKLFNYVCMVITCGKLGGFDGVWFANPARGQLNRET